MGYLTYSLSKCVRRLQYQGSNGGPRREIIVWRIFGNSNLVNDNFVTKFGNLIKVTTNNLVTTIC